MYKYYIVSTAVAVGCVCLSYYFSKKRLKPRSAVDAFKYITIKTVTTEKDCDEMVGELRRRCSTHNALGFDCEWVTDGGKRHPVALVQLSSSEGLCGLFRLSSMKTVPASLKDLLEDEKIYKVGVAAGDDSKYLCRDYAVVLKSTLDLRHLAKLHGYNGGGLASLSKTLLNVELDKSWRVRCSNWEAEELSPRQAQYAAADAHVSVKIFEKLVAQYNRGRLLSQDAWSEVNELCWRYSDIEYRQRIKLNHVGGKESKVHREATEPKKRYPNATRTKPLYHNCFLQAPDGELLCTCDNKKALWYVAKELADVVIEDPLTVRLRFEPSGRSVGEVGRYYQLTKENKCVVCGGHNSYIRKNVVPREYRKCFPEIMKDHSSHDVVLLCASCHQLSNVRDQAVRDKLASMCDAPLATHDHVRTREDAACKKIRSAARALLYQPRKHELPERRREQLEEILLEHYTEHDRVTEELLKEAAGLQVVFVNEDFESHGFKVVEYYLKSEGGLLRLEEVWREHFLQSMRPKYMPHLWSLKHNEERLRVKWDEGRLSEKDLELIGVRWT